MIDLLDEDGRVMRSSSDFDSAAGASVAGAGSDIVGVCLSV